MRDLSKAHKGLAGGQGQRTTEMHAGSADDSCSKDWWHGRCPPGPHRGWRALVLAQLPELGAPRTMSAQGDPSQLHPSGPAFVLQILASREGSPFWENEQIANQFINLVLQMGRLRPREEVRLAPRRTTGGCANRPLDFWAMLGKASAQGRMAVLKRLDMPGLESQLRGVFWGTLANH